MPSYTAVLVAKPTRQLVINALADADGPLAQAVEVGNRPRTRPVLGNKTDPASRPAFNVRWTGFDGPGGYTAAETFALEGVTSFDPDVLAPAVCRVAHLYEIALDTRHFNTDDAADLFDQAHGSLLLSGPALGDTSGKVKNWTVGGGRVDDTANDADTLRGDRGPSPGVASKRVTFVLRVALEIPIHSVIPQEV